MSTQADPEELTCPNCGETYEPGFRHCPHCGTPLAYECPACGALNPVLARRCSACQQELEILDSLFTRITTQPWGDWQRELRGEANALKEELEAASQAHLARMWETDRQYREELAQARAEQERQQRIIVGVAVGLVALAVLAVLIALLIVIGPAGP